MDYASALHVEGWFNNLRITEVFFKKIIFFNSTSVAFIKLFFKKIFHKSELLANWDSSERWNIFPLSTTPYGVREGKIFNGNAI